MCPFEKILEEDLHQVFWFAGNLFSDRTLDHTRGRNKISLHFKQHFRHFKVIVARVLSRCPNKYLFVTIKYFHKNNFLRERKFQKLRTNGEKFSLKCKFYEHLTYRVYILCINFRDFERRSWEQ